MMNQHKSKTNIDVSAEKSRILTIQQVCELLHVSRPTVNRMILAGLPACELRAASKRRVVLMDDLIEYLKRNRLQPEEK